MTATLPEIPAGVPGHRVIMLTLEVVGHPVCCKGCNARVRYSGKAPVWMPWDVVGNPSGCSWESTFVVPVWFYRTIRDKL